MVRKKKKPRPGWEQKELPPTNYFILTCYRKIGDAAISELPDLAPPFDNWFGGEALGATIPQPLEYTIVEDDEGTLLPLYEEAIPLMSLPLVEALTNCGVDNIEIYDALIRETKTGLEHNNYKAFNIVGVVSAAKKAGSEAQRSILSDNGNMSNFFHSLALEEKNIKGLLMFRLAEAVSAILVHKKIRDHLISEGFSRLTFTHPSEWSG